MKFANFDAISVGVILVVRNHIWNSQGFVSRFRFVALILGSIILIVINMLCPLKSS
jgi:hypothetical protein